MVFGGFGMGCRVESVGLGVWNQDEGCRTVRSSECNSVTSALTPNEVEPIPTVGALPPPRRARSGPNPHILCFVC